MKESLPGFYKPTPQEDENQTNKLAEIRLAQKVDGSLHVGSGYAIAPQLFPVPYQGQFIEGYERLPLAPPVGSTSSVADFGTINLNMDEDDPTYGAVIAGGFTQAPIFIEVNASSTREKIASVSLVIDGVITDGLVRTEPPYRFVWIPPMAKDYSVSAIVRDVAGNVNSTEESIFYVGNYEGGGVSLTVLGDSNYSIEAGGQFLVSVESTSEYGVAEVEFFIDNQSVGTAYDSGGISFQKVINLADFDFNQGEHELAIVARDKRGNQAGTFSPLLTNIPSRQNKRLTILPPLIKNPPTITLVSPSSELSVPVDSSVRLQAMANDPDGELRGVQFFINQNLQTTWSGTLDFSDFRYDLADDLRLTLYDGTERDPVTFLFDNDGTVPGSGVPEVVGVFSNVYVNDLDVSQSDYTGFDRRSYRVEIDGVGTTNSFRWTRDGGLTWTDEKVLMKAGGQHLEDGIFIQFNHLEGHQLGDSWTIQAEPGFVVVSLIDTPSDAVDATLARNAFQRAIEEQRSWTCSPWWDPPLGLITTLPSSMPWM